ncbi:CYTH domain-containing protein [Lentiprolixibacter aurantiacus]|uniref:CYTH domain-containing protein n=1 Tax=Lentiprolixibacter aurantiacus TaxID=2993939 RepID=A0AAE3SMF1_9FLAO|nr:CYTH domain-containing protein [Lentiprolixibacter aurantiacus]MCX2718380.1 CYTH domain-containing protein [Lentiprolixibacter aurantiacus]
MIEVERKFLVTSEDFRTSAESALHIRQGFLCADPERTVRVRLQDGFGKITVKGISDEAGISRFEWEHEINGDEAGQLLKLCTGTEITKTRYRVPFGNHIFEVDVFEGSNAGLIVAEVELQTADEYFEKPAWLGREVTGDPKYYNAQLSINSYKQW